MVLYIPLYTVSYNRVYPATRGFHTLLYPTHVVSSICAPITHGFIHPCIQYLQFHTPVGQIHLVSCTQASTKHTVSYTHGFKTYGFIHPWVKYISYTHVSAKSYGFIHQQVSNIVSYTCGSNTNSFTHQSV